MGMFGAAGSGSGIPAVDVRPRKYHPAAINPTVERYNKLYGYPIAVYALNDIKKTFGIGTIGLLVQLLALSTYAVIPAWIATAGIDNLMIFGSAVGYNLVILVAAFISFTLLCTGFLLSRNYKNHHHGAELSCGIYTHTVPVYIVIAIVFLPLLILGAI